MAFRRVLVTGARGMLGRDLIPYLKAKGYDVIGLSSDYLSLLQTADEILKKIEILEPDLIIHAAAYTNVDQAERDADLAMMVNKDGTQKVALAAHALGTILVYISTDYVFDGIKDSPYTIEDRPNPIGVYARSKYYGETLINELIDTAYIIRTSWLYGIHQKNFVEFVLSAARQGREIPVIQDQIGSPTWTGTLCGLIEKIFTSGAYGVYHAADNGALSRYEQALTVCKSAGLPNRCLNPVSAGTLNFPAPRPRYSVLDSSPLLVPFWETSLQGYLRQYMEDLSTGDTSK